SNLRKMASAILMYFANRLSATFCARDSIQMKAPVTSLGWATGVGLGHDRCERGLADRKRIAPQVVAVQLNQVEGVEEYALVSAVVTDEIERGNAVIIAGNSFSVDDAGARAQAGQRINDQREATGEIITGTAVEPHSLAHLPGDNPKTVVLDLVQPLAAG